MLLLRGMSKWAAMAESDKYFEWLKGIGDAHDWKLHMGNDYNRVYHADDHAVGQTYFQLYRKYKDEKMIQPTIKQFDFILYHPQNPNWIGNHLFIKSMELCDALFICQLFG